MTTRKPTAKETPARGPEIDPEAYYSVVVSEGFSFRRMSFGPLAETQARGAFLAELLAAAEGARVVGYAPVEA